MKSHLLDNTQQQTPILVIGAAVGDVLMSLDKLPLSGQDVMAHSQGQQIGGCAFNVIRTLCQLGLQVINGITVGHGSWGKQVEQEMEALGLPVLLRHEQKDNGWCLALVEPDGERTFISVEGCESDWDKDLLSTLLIPEYGIVYVSGYELVSPTAESLQEWLLSLPENVQYYFDLGPRLSDISCEFLTRLLKRNVILSLNRDEIALLCGENSDPITSVLAFQRENPVTMIARLDSSGAWLCQPNLTPIYVPAYQVDVVDSIGAGDCHCGGTIAGLASGLSLIESVKLGNQVAAMVVNRCGSNSPPTCVELAEFDFIEKK